tara:strand:+ start:48 stop:875 length:828 start_codon:yes stop_codon:yes gene_type:complete
MGGEKMSIVVDEAPMQEQPITETQVETQEVEAVTEPEQTLEVNGNVEEIPAKYAGKSMAEVIEMHQHVEQALGKQGSEVGEQRKLIQSLLEAQNLANTTVEPQEEVESFEDTFYTDPAKAVNSAIENHPDVLKARQQVAQQEQQQKLNVLEKAYPDWEKTVADKSFQDWIGASEIRKDIFRKADTDYRPDYAIELFDMYDKVNMVEKTKEVKKSEKAKVDKALRQTVSETRSTQSVGGKKMYRRSDLINLQITDPNRYASLADEIQEAYAEGRVK